MKNQLILFTTFFAVVIATIYSCHSSRIAKDTVVDIDGNVYHTVKIGKQVWMAENLKVTHYRNGDPIPYVADPTQWSNLIIGACCDFDNNLNDAEIAKTFGKLYNWFAVTDKRYIAPQGWHVPTDVEWKILENYLGGDEVAGGKLKEKGAIYLLDSYTRHSHWLSPNVGATNKSGFTALPGGYRYYYDGRFCDLSISGNWWTATKFDTSSVLYRQLDLYDTCIHNLNGSKVNGFSVRCLKD